MYYTYLFAKPVEIFNYSAYLKKHRSKGFLSQKPAHMQRISI